MYHRCHKDERRHSRARRHGRGELKPYPQIQTHEMLMKAGRLATVYSVSVGQLPEEIQRRGGDYRRNRADWGFDDEWRKRRRRRHEEHDSRWRGRDWGYDTEGDGASERREQFSCGYHKNRRFGSRERRARSEYRDRTDSPRNEDRDRFELCNREVEGGSGNLDDRDEVMSCERGEVRDGDIENGGLLKVCRFLNVITKPRTLLARTRQKLGEGSPSNGREPPINYNVDFNKAAFDEEVKIDEKFVIEESSLERKGFNTFFDSSVMIVDVQEEIKKVVEGKIQHTAFKVCDLNLPPPEVEENSTTANHLWILKESRWLPNVCQMTDIPMVQN